MIQIKLKDPTLSLEEEISSEEREIIINNLKSTKESEILLKIDNYIQAQNFQRSLGGSGPVAEVLIMKIVNEFDGNFEIVIED